MIRRRSLFRSLSEGGNSWWKSMPPWSVRKNTPFEDEGMEVDVGMEGRAKALNESDRAAQGLFDSLWGLNGQSPRGPPLRELGFRTPAASRSSNCLRGRRQPVRMPPRPMTPSRAADLGAAPHLVRLDPAFRHRGGLRQSSSHQWADIQRHRALVWPFGR